MIINQISIHVSIYSVLWPAPVSSLPLLPRTSAVYLRLSDETHRAKGAGHGPQPAVECYYALHLSVEAFVWQPDLLLVVRYIYDCFQVRARILNPCVGVPSNQPPLAGLM